MKIREKSPAGVCEQRERTSFGSPSGRGRWSAKRKAAAILRLLRGEDIEVMLERKRLDGFYGELQVASRVEADTRQLQTEEKEETRSQLTQS
jgi:hypothetical protein